jgi:oligopeptide/dipeptide ABC transporter ATP-binding protein
MNALDPVYRVGDQIVEAIRAHEDKSRREAWQQAENLVDLVGLEPSRLTDYPHQFSGGMRQRAVIAMALALDPTVIIADEPTTALDVIVQAQILAKIKEMQARTGVGLILVTHDMSVIAQTCEKVAVMYAGRVVEYGAARVIFGEAFHPYTMGLQNAFPSVKGERRELISMPGYPPELIDIPDRCRFVDRCPFAQDKCRFEEPPLEELPNGHKSACWFNERADEFRELAEDEQIWQTTEAAQAGAIG